ncbi:DinB family protein [Nocardia bhagyanarayanae]|uniref:DinB family protein n=1 Tax=Nocardia bhagyanarayanae TaxID=1215925 RepID=A0A543F7N4_9NOCA|nr:DinB family protein [Nocardia bhagyanarayanae]TQM29831.1 DinB family protein [Nocardia bhagyanarayanae]
MTDCAECGFEYDLELANQTSRLAEDCVAEYRELLALDPERLRRRVSPEIWSPLEYACHVRDVLLTQRERALAARREHRPTAVPMGRDERVEHEGYAEQHPEDVARQLGDAAMLFGNVLDRLGPADWDRELVYTYPERSARTLRWLAVHTLHELRHHLVDMRRQLEVAD